jgi:hypothetical protein
VLRAALIREADGRRRAECSANMQTEVVQLALDLLVREPDLEGFFGVFAKTLVEETESHGCGVWLIDDDHHRCDLWMAYMSARLFTSKTADWDTQGAESVDNGASSALGGVGYMSIVAISGFSGFVGKIRHSTDDSTYTDLITFTNQTTIGAQRIAVAGTINRHLAFSGDVTGSGSITLVAGFARN